MPQLSILFVQLWETELNESVERHYDFKLRRIQQWPQPLIVDLKTKTKNGAHKEDKGEKVNEKETITKANREWTKHI